MFCSTILLIASIVSVPLINGICIICPGLKSNVGVALAENAHENGVEYHFGCEVTAIQRQEDDTYEITTAKGNFKTRWVVNCAGLGCGKISDMLGITGYRIKMCIRDRNSCISKITDLLFICQVNEFLGIFRSTECSFKTGQSKTIMDTLT